MNHELVINKQLGRIVGGQCSCGWETESHNGGASEDTILRYHANHVRFVREYDAITSRVVDAVLDAPALVVGDKVVKVDGYPFPGKVVSKFTKIDGQVRYVVEATGEEYAGMLHIFSGKQLKAAPDKCETCGAVSYD